MATPLVETTLIHVALFFIQQAMSRGNVPDEFVIEQLCCRAYMWRLVETDMRSRLFDHEIFAVKDGYSVEAFPEAYETAYAVALVGAISKQQGLTYEQGLDLSLLPLSWLITLHNSVDR